MNGKMTFEQGMQELETLVQGLERGEMTLEESFAAYERAMRLRAALKELLDEGDRRIRVLTEAGEHTLEEAED